MRRRVGLLGVVVALLAPASAQAATLQPIGTFSSPVYVTSEPTDPNRVLVVQKGGTVILREGATSTTWLPQLSPIATTGEQGLLSIAFAPDYATTGHFYAFYTATSSTIRVSEFTADATPPVDLGTERVVLSIPNSASATNHNAGQLQIGADDNLYISTGDGGDTPQTAQDETSLLGKILRIDPDPGGGGEYTIPPGNPFAGPSDPGADEVWAMGLRNPFRFSFDRLTGDMLIGDVGQAQREEVDYLPSGTPGGVNFGWDCREGFNAHNAACANDPGFTDPIDDYLHSTGGCSITGGYVARDPAIPELAGRYLYADFCVGQVRSLVPGLPRASGDRCENISVAGPTSFGEDASGRLYVASLGGQVFRIVPGGSPCADGTGGDAPPTGGGPGGGDSGGGEPPPTASLDTRAPAFELSARDRQRLGDDRELACRLESDESATADANLALVAGDRVLARLGQKESDLAAGREEKLVWKISRAELREVRRPLRKGKLEARFRARAFDLAGNATPSAEARSEIG